MSYNNTYDAQLFIVQGVITRKTLESNLANATTQNDKNVIKGQIRQLQWNIDQANKYLLANGIQALRYSNEIFSVDGFIKTPWDNEKNIPGTLRYDAAANVLPEETIETANAQQIEDLNNILLETNSLLKQNKTRLEAARLLPDTSTEKQNIILESKNAIKQLSTTIRSLQEQKDSIPTVLSVPSVKEINDKFSLGIRNSLKQSLLSKPGYTEQYGDVDAALRMRKIALDAFYTAKNEEQKKAAEDRLRRVYESLAPEVPVTRKEMETEELFISNIVEQIAAYNQIIYPKTVRVDSAQAAYATARENGVQSEIDAAKTEYDSASADYDITLTEIKKLYDRLLGYHSSFGVSAMYPGSNTVATIKPTIPADGSNSSGKSTGYPLIYDVVEERFVSQKEAGATPGRYVTTEYVNTISLGQKTTEQQIQETLSIKYLQASKAEAEYTYKKETEHLIFQNENRYARIFEANQDLEKLDKDFAEKQVKGGLTSEDYLEYQSKKQTINQKIADDQKVIQDNRNLIKTAEEKRDAGLNPFKVLETTQKETQTYIDGTNRKLPTSLPTDEAKTLSKDYYASKDERILAERQLNTAKDITKNAEEAGRNSAIAAGKDPQYKENWDPALREKWEDAKTKEDGVRSNLEAAQIKEQNSAIAAKAFIEKDLNGGDLKEKMLANGLNPTDISNSINSAAQELDRKTELTKQLRASLAEKLGDSINEKSDIEENLNKTQTKLKELKSKESLTPEEEAQIKKLEKKEAELLKELKDVDKEIEKLENASTEEAIETAIKNEYDYERQLEIDIANTGFEGINNNAPFYMQFPTLNSITDFKLRNGVDPYGAKTTEEIARDAVVFKIFETVPGVAKAEQVVLPNGAKYIKNIPQKTNINTVGSFTIYPSHSDGMGNWLEQQHTHNWESGERDMVAQLFQTAGDFLTGAESLLTVARSGLEALDRGQLKGSDVVGSVYQRQVDVLDYYKNTETKPITVTFNLFTRNNFLNDVFRPIMFLTAVGYPKRSMTGNAGKLFDSTMQKISKLAAANPDSTIADYIKAGADKLKGLGKPIDEVERKLAEFGGLGPYRYFISKRPEYMTIRHASGLFYFPVAYIADFSYTFKGPWYNFNGQPLESTRDLDNLIFTKIEQLAPPPEKTFREKMNETFTDLARNIRETFKPPPKPVARPKSPESRIIGATNGLLEMSDGDLAFIRQKGLPFAYPSWAECKITFKNATPFFRDDFMAMFYESQQGGEELVTLTQELTNQTEFAFGGKTAAENLADDAFRQKIKGK